MEDLILQLNRSITDLHRSTGRIEARLEHGDTMFREIRDDLQEIKGKVATIEASKPASPKPSRLETTQKLVEVVIPALKEVWPFLAMTAAGVAKLLGASFSLGLGP